MRDAEEKYSYPVTNAQLIELIAGILYSPNAKELIFESDKISGLLFESIALMERRIKAM